MAITVPLLFTNIADAEVTYQRSVTEETKRKMAQNLNMLGKLAPIGSVRMLQLNQTGVLSPDPTIFQLMDGSEITDPSSPLRTVGLTQRFTPDMRARYPRGAPSASVNNSGGSATTDLAHDHGGTGVVNGGVHGEEGEERTARVSHAHPINEDLNEFEPLDPAHQILAFYLKIN